MDTGGPLVVSSIFHHNISTAQSRKFDLVDEQSGEQWINLCRRRNSYSVDVMVNRISRKLNRDFRNVPSYGSI